MILVIAIIAAAVLIVVAFVLWGMFSKSPDWYVGKGPSFKSGETLHITRIER